MSEENNTEEAEKRENTKDEKPASESDTKSDINVDGEVAKKIIYSLCYLWGILFFLPLILYKNDADAKRHANEGLLLFIISVIGNVVFGILTRITSLFGIVAAVYSVLLLALGIIGIIYVVTDRNKPLPFIGGIKLIK